MLEKKTQKSPFYNVKAKQLKIQLFNSLMNKRGCSYIRFSISVIQFCQNYLKKKSFHFNRDNLIKKPYANKDDINRKILNFKTIIT